MSKAPKAQPDAGPLLSSVAAALTACEKAGIAVRFRHGALMSDYGYVLQAGEKTWVARTRAYAPFPVTPGDDED